MCSNRHHLKEKMANKVFVKRNPKGENQICLVIFLLLSIDKMLLLVTMLIAAQFIFSLRGLTMSKVLKSFCCLTLLVTLNLCGTSATDYLMFNNFKPFECSKCKKRGQGSIDAINDIRQSNELVNYHLDVLDSLGFSMPNIYWAVVRFDDKKALMCSDCGCKDKNEQIKALVKEFCPGFNFSAPCQRDVENLIQNDSFIQRIPRQYVYNMKNFEDGKCICAICLGDREEEKIDVFKRESYYVCINCGGLFHKECEEKWARKNFNCPSCRNKFGIILYSDDIATEGKKFVFKMWVKNNCSLPLQSDYFEALRNMNEAEVESCSKLLDRSENDGIPDEFVDLLLPKRIAPESKCSRFCNCLRSFFGC